MLLEPMLAVVDLVTTERRTLRVIGRILQLLLALHLLVGLRFMLIILELWLRLFILVFLGHIIGVLHHRLLLFDDRSRYTFDRFLFNLECIGLICSW